MERDHWRSGREERSCAPSSAPPAPPAGCKITEGEEEEEERVEKFYVLLEHIKAMRDLIGRNKTSKRQKIEAAPMTETAQLWRPTFEMEDFGKGGGGVAMAEESASSALMGPPKLEEHEEDECSRDQIRRQEQGGDSSVDLSLSLGLVN